MRVNSINSNVNSQAVNQKYLQRSQKEYKQIGCITNHLQFCLVSDVVLFKNMPIQDGIDTLKAIKNLVKNSDPCIDKDIELLTKLLRK